RPDAKEMIEKVAPYQGWIGVGAALWGAWSVVRVLSQIDLIGYAPIAWLTGLVVAVVTLGNGFLLGFGLGMTFVSDEKPKEKARALYHKVAPYQTRLGLAAIVIGAWSVLRSVLG